MIMFEGADPGPSCYCHISNACHYRVAVFPLCSLPCTYGEKRKSVASTSRDISARISGELSVWPFSPVKEALDFCKGF